MGETKRTTRVVLDLTDEEEIAIGYAIGAALLVRVDGVDSKGMRKHILSLAGKIYAANEAAAFAEREKGVGRG